MRQASAWHLIREENADNRPLISLTQTVGQAPEFPILDVDDREKTNQVPGQFLITIFLLIYLSIAFGGYFTPERPCYKTTC